jgi:hypothetical protein
MPAAPPSRPPPALETAYAAEILRTRIDHQETVGSALMTLDIQLTHASGDVPIHRAHIVAGLVGAHFVAFDATPLKDRQVVPGKQVLDFMARADLDAADLVDQVI